MTPGEIASAFAGPDEALRAIWEDVLGVPVGLDDDFVELGGDSLRAFQIIARVREEVGIELSVLHLFEARTIEAVVAFRPPETVDERRVAEVWGEVLRIGRIGLDDDFFQLGGDSLLGLQVLVRLAEDPGVELPLATIFEHRTLAALALQLAQRPTQAAMLPALTPIPRDRLLPASHAQAQACFFHELEPDALPYQFQASIRLEGVLDVRALERALAEIVRRHEILRTTFAHRDGQWLQVVHDPFAVTLETIDLRRESDVDAALTVIVEEAFRTRIELDRLPLVSWELVRCSDTSWVLLDVEHHVIHDGWSFTVFLGELAALYATFAAGLMPDLPEPTVQYADWAVWQRHLVASDLASQQLDYWRGQLADLPPPLELSFDRPRPRAQTFRGSTVRVEVPPDVRQALRSLSREQGSTLFMLMLAAFLVVLRGHGGGDDLVVGSGLANRRSRDSEQLLGMLVNTVALRVDLSGDPTLRELLQRVRKVALAAYVNQDIPFEQVIENLAPDRSGSHTPVYQSIFSFHDAPLPESRLPGLHIVPEEVRSNGSTKADVNVVVISRRSERGEGPAEQELTVVWEYGTDLFDHGTAERMVAHYLALLASLPSHLDRRLSELTLIGEEERRYLMRDLNATDMPYEHDASIAQIFRARVAEAPDATALVGEGVEISYSEVDCRSDRLARGLQLLGVGHGTLVGVCLERSPEQVVTLLGILKAGGAYVALDPTFPAERLRLLVDDAGLSLVCTGEPFLDLVRASGAEPVSVREVECAGALEHLSDVGCGDDLAYVAYTSGSTGVPKGVEVPQRAVIRLVRGIDYVDLGPGETSLALAPLSFDASTFEIWGALLNGGCLALAPEGALSAHEIAETLRRYRVTTLWLTAGLFHLVVEYEPGVFSEVRQVIAGGDVVSPSHVARVLRVLPPGGVFVNGYGPTEATTFTCCHRIPAGGRVDGPVPIGRPIANTRVYVVDERGQPVPTGVPGELYIGGDGIARGYLNDPELTAQRFVPDPFSGDPRARLYRSGDRVRWRADGVLEFLGRLDRQVKIRGFRAEPGEIEHVLRGHPAVREVAVDLQELGPNDRRLVAYVALEGNEEAALEALRRYASEQLPRFLLPASWVLLERLPLLASGKLDKAALPVPRDDEVVAPASRAPTELEAKLIAVWQEVLGVRSIRLDDDFFDLGGHSLLAVELFAAIERTTGARLPLATIFEARTVSRLAIAMRSEGWEAPWSVLVPLRVTGSRPPLFLVTAGDGNVVGYGALARRLGPDQPFYALQPRGLHGRRLLDTRIERMAARYLREVLRVQPRGPYMLGGRCLGGLVAFEMARRLEERGDDVALLVALDSLGPRWSERRLANGLVYDEVMSLSRLRAGAEGLDLGDPSTPEGTEALLAWLAQPVGSSGKHVINRYLFEAFLSQPEAQAAFPDPDGEDAGRLVDWGWSWGYHLLGLERELLPAPSEAGRRVPLPRTSIVRPRAEMLRGRAREALDVAARARLPGWPDRQSRRVEVAAALAVQEYRARPYGGRLTLIRSEEYIDHPLLARWYEVALGGVEERVVRGSHRSILREPDVAGLADCLEECLEAATRLSRAALHASC